MPQGISRRTVVDHPRILRRPAGIVEPVADLGLDVGKQDLDPARAVLRDQVLETLDGRDVYDVYSTAVNYQKPQIRPVGGGRDQPVLQLRYVGEVQPRVEAYYEGLREGNSRGVAVSTKEGVLALDEVRRRPPVSPRRAPSWEGSRRAASRRAAR